MAAQELLDSVVRHQIELQRYSNNVVRRIVAVLNRADADISAALMAMLDRAPENLTVEYLDSLLASVRQLNAAAYATLQNELEGSMRELAGFETRWHEATYTTALDTRFAQVTAETAYTAAMSRPFQGRLLREWGQSLEADRMRRIRDAVRMGYLEGKTTAQVVRDIRGTKARAFQDGIIEIDRRHAEAVARTALSHMAATTRDRFFEANDDILGDEVWVSTLDGRTSQECFPESTGVLPVGNIRGVTRRFWNGYMVVITTASGKKIKATPNHPVLTARGWRPINELRPGCDVLHRVVVDVGGVSATKDIEMPSTIGALANALNEPSIVDVSVERATQTDFHGDGMLGEQEIYRVNANSDLRAVLNAKLGKNVAEKLLVLVDGSALFLGERKVLEFLKCAPLLDVATEIGAVTLQDRVQSGLADLGLSADGDGLYAGAKHFNDLRFISAQHSNATTECRHYTGAFEYSSNRSSCDPVRSTNTGSGESVRVVADDVVAVNREFFSGHVFNLSTSTEFYIADGFIVHNCRVRDGKRYTRGTHRPVGHTLPWGSGPGRLHWQCRSTAIALLKGQTELFGTRAAKGGQVDANESYGAWLKRQPASVQDDILGPSRGALFRRGGLEVEQFSNDKGKTLTLAELEERHAAAFRRAGVEFRA